MKKYYTIFIIVFLSIITAIFFYNKQLMTSASEEKIHNKSTKKRIISLAPSITETLFALNLGDNVVGVTRYCLYPSEAQKKVNVGGYADPNYEAMAALKPDLVIVLPEHEKVRNYLTELGLKYLIVNNKTVLDILSALITIGNALGAEDRALELLTSINARIQNIKEQIKDLSQPRVLISIGRTMGSGSLKDVYIAGKNTFFDELITYAGGINAFQDEKIAYPMLSAEGVLFLNPDIIIDLVPDLDSKGLTEAMILKEWESVSKVTAVKNRRVFILSKEYVVIPGPRFILLLEDIARILHPKIRIDNT